MSDQPWVMARVMHDRGDTNGIFLALPRVGETLSHRGFTYTVTRVHWSPSGAGHFHPTIHCEETTL